MYNCESTAPTVGYTCKSTAPNVGYNCKSTAPTVGNNWNTLCDLLFPFFVITAVLLKMSKSVIILCLQNPFPLFNIGITTRFVQPLAVYCTVLKYCKLSYICLKAQTQRECNSKFSVNASWNLKKVKVIFLVWYVYKFFYSAWLKWWDFPKFLQTLAEFYIFPISWPFVEIHKCEIFPSILKVGLN